MKLWLHGNRITCRKGWLVVKLRRWFLQKAGGGEPGSLRQRLRDYRLGLSRSANVLAKAAHPITSAAPRQRHQARAGSQE